MTNETGLLRDLNLKPGDRVVDKEGMDVNIINRHGVLTALWINGTSISVTQSIGIYTVTHRSPRTIGTLKEIGAKVGDVVKIGQNNYTVGKDFIHDGCTCEVVSRATPISPVRTVTKKEIVPGVYGKVIVDMLGGIGVSVQELHDADELTAAINTLTEIREAM